MRNPRLFVVATVLYAGCLFDTSIPGVDNSDIDAMRPLDAPDDELTDGGPDGGPLCIEWLDPPAHFDPCSLPEPITAEPLVLDIAGMYTIDTIEGELIDPTGITVPYAGAQIATYWVMSVEGLEISSGVTLRAEGQRPLVVASWGEIRVDGDIDVSSNSVDPPAAGSNPQVCSAHPAGNGNQDDQGGGGGGGAGFGSQGGFGGDGPDAGGTGGVRGNTVAQPDAVRGGCNGGSGGDGAVAGGFGLGGGGGGAIQLTARTIVTINGRINASGQGGKGADGAVSQRSAGGGGGSGGLIGIDAPMVNITVGSVLAANGGGGGQGAGVGPGESGQDGKLGRQIAFGGTFGSGSGGGQGAALDDLVARDGGSNPSAGGGGGGGGVGWIIIRSGDLGVNPGAILSPAYSLATN